MNDSLKLLYRILLDYNYYFDSNFEKVEDIKVFQKDSIFVIRYKLKIRKMDGWGREYSYFSFNFNNYEIQQDV